MNTHDQTAPMQDCWNRIGSRGDGSCVKLDQHVHCRNCDVFGASARELMQRELPADYRREWSAHFARAEQEQRQADQSALIFRIGAEWLALPTKMAVLVADPIKPRRLPHRPDPAVMGIVNLRGRLYPCMSLAHLMQIEASEPAPTPGVRVAPRILVIQFEQLAVALPVQDLLGVHRYSATDLELPPAAFDNASQRYVQGILTLDGRRVGCIDAGLLGFNLAGRLK